MNCLSCLFEMERRRTLRWVKKGQTTAGEIEIALIKPGCSLGHPEGCRKFETRRLFSHIEKKWGRINKNAPENRGVLQIAGSVNTACCLVPVDGIEPPTFSLRMNCSTN